MQIKRMTIISLNRKPINNKHGKLMKLEKAVLKRQPFFITVN